MAREIIFVHVGELGIKMAPDFWKIMCDEHNLDYNGIIKGPPRGVIDNVFQNTSGDKWVPRAIMVDLSPYAFRQISKKEMTNFFDPKRAVIGLKGDANNFAKGFYSDGPTYLEAVMTKIQGEIDQTKHLQGFIICHSLGDGTGAGMAPLIIRELKKKNTKAVIMSYSIIPSQYMDCATVQPYNAIFSLDVLTEFADMTMIIDNDSLYRIVTKKANVNDLTEAIFNRVLAKALAEITATLRFNSPLNRSMTEMLTNLIPFPRNHFLLTSMSPIDLTLTSIHEKISTEQLMDELVDNDNILAPISTSKGVFSGLVMALRGENANSILQKCIKNYGDKIKFSDLFPTAIKADSTTLVETKIARSGVTMMNHSGIATMFEKLVVQFDLMHTKRAYMLWYLKEGMTENHFTAAKQNIQNLINEYRQDEG